jgi:uroporphyrin-3 C-methyltransferase
MTDKSNKDNQKTSSKSQGGDLTPVEENSSPAEKTETKVHKKKKVKNKTKKESQPISKMALLALLVSVLIGGSMAYQDFVLQEQQHFSTKLLNSLLDSQDRLKQVLKNTRQALATESKARKKTEAEFLSFKIAMEALATKLGRTSNEWRLAEIEYLLTIANHRIALANDLVTAVTIFETADQRIKLLSDPALLKIRKSIKDELLSLRAVQQPDLAGMALSLGSLASEVENLPLIDKERVSAATGEIKDQGPESWRDIPAAVWKDIKSLVVVRRHQKATEPLLPPSESWFLYQNLRLKLEQARLSLLRRDTGLFHQNLKEADAWIKTFFNEESSSVVSVLKQISILVEIELQPASPDVSGSLLQLRSLLAERGVKIGRK